MTLDNQSITITGTPVQEGTAMEDTKYDHVFWIAGVGDHEITVEVAHNYRDESRSGRPQRMPPTRVADGPRL